jgi:hypothetical protein
MSDHGPYSDSFDAQNHSDWKNKGILHRADVGTDPCIETTARNEPERVYCKVRPEARGFERLTGQSE